MICINHVLRGGGIKMDILRQVENKIIKLEAKIAELRESNEKWKSKLQGAERKIEKLEMKVVNESELEYLRTENSKLKVENMQLQKSAKALDKLRKIEKILKG